MRRLLVLYGAAITSIVIVALLGPLAMLVRSMAEEHAIGLAHQEAQGVAVVAAVASGDRLTAVVRSVNASTQRQTTVFLPDGTSIGVPAKRSASVELAARGRAFTADVPAGREVLIPVGGPKGVAVVRTLVPTELLREGWRPALFTLAAVGAVLLAMAIFAAERIATRMARSVRDLASVANRLGEGDLAAHVVPDGPPEVASVGRVLNRLGDRINELLASEREFVADLSHRLRTPITALRLDAEGLSDPEERRQMGRHIAELEASVDALIRAARQPGGHLGGPANGPAGGQPARRAEQGRCDAVRVVADRARFWSVLAEDQHRPLRVDLPNFPCVVRLEAARLGASLDALIDNVFAHTPDGSAFVLSVTRRRGGPFVVAVEDAGSGIADLAMTRRGRSGVGSTGLGLHVVRRDAEEAGGRLLVGRSPAGGARVVLELPPA
ncbi:Signal transduction histidine kinase [Actinopolymorpha cephalotaxi]|uniref:histidine kinase n=1 Tax=Actinopolymorpha cephalotaxi TaxID=504797 RepID=A0A1I2XQ16_9ACTN|nr:HAMP domain-containing sensor histidine kinase [Actinopolymorpha cephalotaxi]NYH87124.1 signal transduction histidine kinase [Actinopolymorpha cephalotaxi]SFH15502.1 Signal transduction histidine kinase [Actinopolymorpha cephalotaxi]